MTLSMFVPVTTFRPPMSMATSIFFIIVYFCLAHALSPKQQLDVADVVVEVCRQDLAQLVIVH